MYLGYRQLIPILGKPKFESGSRGNFLIAVGELNSNWVWRQHCKISLWFTLWGKLVRHWDSKLIAISITLSCLFLISSSNINIAGATVSQQLRKKEGTWPLGDKNGIFKVITLRLASDISKLRFTTRKCTAIFEVCPYLQRVILGCIDFFVGKMCRIVSLAFLTDILLTFCKLTFC